MTTFIWKILGDNSTCSNHHIISQGNTWTNRSIGSNPSIISNGNGCSELGTTGTKGGIDRMGAALMQTWGASKQFLPIRI